MSRFVTSLENLTEKGKLDVGLKFLIIDTTIMEKLERVTSTLNKGKWTFSLTFDNDQDSAVDTEDEQDEEKDTSTQFLSTQENTLLELPQHFERFVKTLPVFGVDSTDYDFILIKSYLILLLANEKGIEPKVIKEAN